MKKGLFLLAALAVLSSCRDNDEDDWIIYNEGPPPEISVDRELLSLLKTKAVDTLTIEPYSYVLDAYLWRDFMPISPPNGKGMISINWLVNTDSLKVPDNIRIVKQYVIHNDSIWVADYKDREPTPSLPAYKIERVSGHGPKWGPRIYVEVISLVYDSKTQNEYYIKREDVYVERTD